ncbi:hypothetical protein HOY80DRAFT_1046857 [Tuber brumale]|nr:hypothetical protein HOY80DRAFT_1046857 [Tuber brumale]
MQAACFDCVNLSASGFNKMPTISNDVAIAEVELDMLTGANTGLRVHIGINVGRPINPPIAYGHIGGGSFQDQCPLTIKKTHWQKNAELIMRSTITYKIPGDLTGSARPFFWGSSALFALREAGKAAWQSVAAGAKAPSIVQWDLSSYCGEVDGCYWGLDCPLGEC